MAVSASTGVMSSLLSKLSMLLSDKYKQLKGVRRDIESLTLELTDMNAALVTLAEREELDVQTKVWRDKVREMAYDIENVIDIFMHHHGQGDDKDGLFYKTARKIRKLRARFQIAGMIQDIKARVAEQSQSRDRYKVNESTTTSKVVEVDPRLPAMFEDAKRLVGIDGPREEIIKWMTEEVEDGSGILLKVVSIVGFGGLGKTTLANQVHAKIKNEFECTAFVSVSRTPDMQKILQDILSRVGHGGTQVEDDVPKLIEIIRSHLADKRYLIVIDDLWSTDDWCTIKCAFVENNNGSRVITTTRHHDVATACCSPGQGYAFQMQPLDEHHSRRLFFKRIFDKEDSCPEHFREISDDMLRKCKGVPLAITSIASLLANQSMHVESWEKIFNSLGSELDTNPTLKWMRHVLSLSYNDLSHELKTCLLYLGMYPEDRVIRTYELVNKWIAEGLIKEKAGLDLEEAAENCLNELINRSMIEPCFDPYFAEVKKCRVHDLMLDLIVSKCKEENFITIIDRKFTINGASQVRRASHQFKNRDMPLAVKRMRLSHIRSYISFPMSDFMPLLAKFELLRVLDIERKDRKSLLLDLSAINDLFLLRYTRVSGFRLKLPNKFGKLNHLMTLDIELTFLDPSDQISDFSSLSSLRYLALPRPGGVLLRNGRIDLCNLLGVALRNGLSNLCNLRTLLGFNISANSVECIRDLGELTNLRDLGLFYNIPCDVEDNSDTILASLDKLGNSNLRSLTCHNWRGASSTQSWSNFLTRPRHLQSLYLDCLMHKVPKWMACADRLAYLNLLKVQELLNDDIQVLAQLPCLIRLSLKAKTVPEKSIIIHLNTFPRLTYFALILSELSCLTFLPPTMPRLQKLELQLDGRGQGAKMQLQEGSPVGGIEHLESLEDISVRIQLRAKCRGHGSKIESALRDTISRHPKSEAIRIYVSCTEYDENGKPVAGISGGD